MSEEYTAEDRSKEDILFLREVLDPRNSRVASIVLDHPTNLKIAEGTGLAVSRSRRLSRSNDMPMVNISLAKKVKDVPGIISWIDEFFYDKDVFRRAHMLYLQVADMVVADACTFMLDVYHNICNDDHDKCCASCDTEAEISVLLGLFFGYSLCCVKYYIDTHHLGQQGYDEAPDIAYDEHGHYRGVPCPMHAHRRMKAKGQNT
ncbi:MAG: hypothetical protein Q8P37_01350 [Candidatus Spechtbacteria bacterium]|nr:hypothetical protein [Candidatus Spechtbacteria bacterium]